MEICRSQRAARSSSWVTTKSVIPLSRLRAKRRFSTTALVASDPAEREFAFFAALSFGSNWSREANPRPFRSRLPTPAIASGTMTLSSTVAPPVRKNRWNTNPKAPERPLHRSALAEDRDALALEDLERDTLQGIESAGTATLGRGDVTGSE